MSQCVLRFLEGRSCRVDAAWEWGVAYEALRGSGSGRFSIASRAHDGVHAAKVSMHTGKVHVAFRQAGIHNGGESAAPVPGQRVSSSRRLGVTCIVWL
jgi:hypothetical protein